jgi:hypothetical protein
MERGRGGRARVEQVVDGDLVRGAPELRRERWMDGSMDGRTASGDHGGFV